MWDTPTPGWRPTASAGAAAGPANRWPLVWAAAPAVVVGYLATLMPEWLELTVGVPLILLTYGWVIWHKGFGPEDRVLFRKQQAQDPV